MARFLLLLSCIGLLYFSWPSIEKNLENKDSFEQIQSEIETIKNNPETSKKIDELYGQVQQVLSMFENKVEKTQPTKEIDEKINLRAPAEQFFSIHNIELGDSKTEIEQKLGSPKRSSLNEYGTNWNTYHDNYRNFFMVMYDQNNKAAGLYTNQDLISSKNGMKLGTQKTDVRKALGEPLTKIQKGLIIYQLDQNSDYDVFLKDGVYITIFYDKHEQNTVTAMQLISKEMEQRKTDFYTKASTNLKKGFEFQLFDLTNAARVRHQLPILAWDEHVRETARKHSTDMAENKYFDHTNLKGQSPFDRMKEDHIIFMLAGENLAYGQLSSIFAHEGLMNSLGHRENILRKGYKFLGVGVAFNDKSQPYYTENFYAK
ncbi:CAP domain-containing protein [Neobacillus kokaensis]|uniref:CAP domain-containing protein n=1 Tax=Neobacillus kokaensis TaxID=2759023 RepID=A0ABQ3N4I9_9BACI|nr:CAP domain-containing protein [Neobacillus kokaensis]GHH99006.1 CAP domain-containing protein [Neobacillus kokaensis]